MKRTIAIALGDNGRSLATLRYDVQGAVKVKSRFRRRLSDGRTELRVER